MVFIWNGIYSKVVQDEEFERNNVSYRGYVVVRRLYVFSKYRNERLAKDYLYKHFGKYGAIESIKIKEGTNEGYVTFVSDGAAYEAFLVESVDHSEIRTEIAFPWHQPKPKIETAKVNDGAIAVYKPIESKESATSPILDLCDDLLFMIFDCCNIATFVNLSETCVHLGNLLKKHYCFPKIDKTLVVRRNNDLITLIDFHKLLRLMGRYFEKLHIDVCGGKAADKIICRYSQEIGKYCTNIQNMRFIVKVFRNDFISLLEPIFKNLNTLEINVLMTSEVNPGIDFTELLPKLKKIKLTHKLLRNCLKKSWPSLESFYYDHVFSISEKDFFALNPQLECLKFDDDGIDNLEAAADYLPNIDKIELFSFFNSFDPIIHLQRFTHLAELKIGIIDRQKLNELRGHLSGLNHLKELRIFIERQVNSTSEDQHQMIVSLAKTHQKLERFDLIEFNLDEATVVDFVRIASKLKSLHLHGCGIFATASLITKIVEVRKCNPKNTKKLEFFIDESDQNDFDTINENEVQQYLSVEFCKNSIVCFLED